jgi:hypothetical protein
MKRKGYYSPALRRELVTRLYHTARELRIPMTVLNDRIVQEALDRMVSVPFPSKQPSTAAVAA